MSSKILKCVVYTKFPANNVVLLKVRDVFLLAEPIDLCAGFQMWQLAAMQGLGSGVGGSLVAKSSAAMLAVRAGPMAWLRRRGLPLHWLGSSKRVIARPQWKRCSRPYTARIASQAEAHSARKK